MVLFLLVLFGVVILFVLLFIGCRNILVYTLQINRCNKRLAYIDKIYRLDVSEGEKKKMNDSLVRQRVADNKPESFWWPRLPDYSVKLYRDE